MGVRAGFEIIQPELGSCSDLNRPKFVKKSKNPDIFHFFSETVIKSSYFYVIVPLLFNKLTGGTLLW